MNEDFLTGKVLKGLGGLYTVQAQRHEYQCRAASRIRKEDGIKLLAGDNVVFTDNKDGSGFITRVLERKNSFRRPAVANVDMLAIIVSTDEPKPDAFTVDKLSVLAVKADAEVYIIITKTDIEEPDVLLSIYQKTPFLLSATDIENDKSISEIKDRLSGRITVFTGVSGAGKSTLINRLYSDLNAQTGELSEKIKRGKNTTRVTELFSLRDGTYIADTPGFGFLELEQNGEIVQDNLVECFPDFMPFIGHCRYTKCTHTKEEGCAVIQAAQSGGIAWSRHESYIRLYEEIRDKAPY